MLLRKVACYLVLCSSLASADSPVLPEAVITDKFGNPPPSAVDAGSGYFTLSASKSVAGDLKESTVWVVTPKAVADRCTMYYPQREIVVPVIQGVTEINVQLIVALDSIPSQSTVTIKVNQGPNPPPVPPNPPTPVPPNPTPPNPTPVPPSPTTWGAAEMVYQFGMMVKSPTRATTATNLANAVLEERKAFEKDSTMGLQQLVDNTDARMNSMLTSAEKAQWANFPNQLNVMLTLLKEVGINGKKLTTREDHIEVWSEISTGLREVTNP